MKRARAPISRNGAHLGRSIYSLRRRAGGAPRPQANRARTVGRRRPSAKMRVAREGSARRAADRGWRQSNRDDNGSSGQR